MVREVTATIQGWSGRQGEAMDEAFDAEGGTRALYRSLLSALDAAGSGEVAARIETHLERAGVIFGSGKGAVFAVDPVPRLIAADEWKRLSLGLAQRADALDAFIADVYGAARDRRRGPPARAGDRELGALRAVAAGVEHARRALGAYLRLRSDPRPERRARRARGQPADSVGRLL